MFQQDMLAVTTAARAKECKQNSPELINNGQHSRLEGSGSDAIDNYETELNFSTKMTEKYESYPW